MDMDKSIRDLTSKYKRMNKRYSEMVNLTLKNAYLMPSDLRDKAQIYLESLENDFKVGLFGSKKKTEEERNRRLTDFLNELQTNRSEEHTSELQSRGHLVCRLLLEKKNENKAKS